MKLKTIGLLILNLSFAMLARSQSVVQVYWQARMNDSLTVSLRMTAPDPGKMSEEMSEEAST